MPLGPKNVTAQGSNVYMGLYIDLIKFFLPETTKPRAMPVDILHSSVCVLKAEGEQFRSGLNEIYVWFLLHTNKI